MGSPLRGRVSGERRPALRSASSLRTGVQLAVEPGLSRSGAGRAAKGKLRDASGALGRCVGPAATRAPSTWGAAGRGRGQQPGRAREGAGWVCRKFEAGRETPGPGWRPWEGWGWGGASGWQADWSEAATDGGGRFPTSFREPLENLAGGKQLIKDGAKKRRIEEV